MQNRRQLYRSALCHFECEGTQCTCSVNSIYPPTLTRTVKSSLFPRAHPSPCSLGPGHADDHANRSCYINNGCTFPGLNIHTHTHTRLFTFLTFYLLNLIARVSYGFFTNDVYRRDWLVRPWSPRRPSLRAGEQGSRWRSSRRVRSPENQERRRPRAEAERRPRSRTESARPLPAFVPVQPEGTAQ